MGLRVDIYKTAGGNCSNGGVSSSADRLTLVNVDGPFAPSEDAPPALLVEGHLPGALRIIPAEECPETGVGYVPIKPKGALGPMAGGTYAGTSDGRFGEAVAKLKGGPSYGVGPVAFHDRFETQAQYDALTR